MSILNGLKGCWSTPLGPTGGALLNDVSVFNTHGSFLSFASPSVSWTAIGTEMMLDFNGTNTRVRLGRTEGSILDILGDVTVVTWMRRRNATFKYSILVDANNLAYINYRLGVDTSGTTGQNVFFSILDTTYEIRHPQTTVPNVTYCVGGTRTKKSSSQQVLQVYLDGIPGTPFTGNLDPSLAAGSHPVIGCFANFTAGLFDGFIGETAIWERALSDDEMLEVARLGQGWIGRELTGLNWKRKYARVQTNNRRRRLLCGGMT